MAVRHALLAIAIVAKILQALDQEPESMDTVDQDVLSHEQLVKAHSLIDVNKDGKMSMQELMDFCHKTRAAYSGKDVVTVFEEMDSNKDGKLSFDEIQTSESVESNDEAEKKEIEANHAREKAKFEAADLDRDGLLSSQEAAGLFYPELNEEVLKLIAEHSIDSKDTDKDGGLSPSEFWEGDLSSEDGSVQEEEMKEFKSLDADGDGKLSVQELMAWESGVYHTKTAMAQLIATADKDSDGHITADELTGARESLSGTDAGYHVLEWAEHHEL